MIGILEIFEILFLGLVAVILLGFYVVNVLDNVQSKTLATILLLPVIFFVGFIFFYAIQYLQLMDLIK